MSGICPASGLTEAIHKVNECHLNKIEEDIHLDDDKLYALDSIYADVYNVLKYIFELLLCVIMTLASVASGTSARSAIISFDLRSSSHSFCNLLTNMNG